MARNLAFNVAPSGSVYRFDVDPRAAARLADWAGPKIGRFPLGRIPGFVIPSGWADSKGVVAAVYDPIRQTMTERFPATWQMISKTTLVVFRYSAGMRFPRHHDVSGGTRNLSRYLSASVQLSATRGHEGGRLSLWRDGPDMPPFELTEQQGSGVAFQAEVLHEVSEITRGERVALVVWFWGSPDRGAA